mgnify:CR=1 FL=1
MRQGALRFLVATDVAARWGEALGDAITTFTDADGRNYTAHEIYHVD